MLRFCVCVCVIHTSAVRSYFLSPCTLNCLKTKPAGGQVVLNISRAETGAFN